MVSPGTGSGERPGGSALSEINVTPFVDVVLVLLVIFLITAPMMLGGIDVKVPKSEAKNVGPEERLMLTVTKEKVVYLDNQIITLARLEGVLAGLRQRNTKAAVFLRADEGVAYGAVVKVMDAVKKAGIERVGMVTEPIPPVTKGR
ncbi:biopolymer transporter ExbD [Candidatus Methylomirabilis sp.]|uniref:Biopolymer transporter ExbD n=1 Tax=Candidatus Methylomirabilis tolerans TaxID=3123416 RepID=A0AAJ1AKG4_9BACT|nr:biopolymer transporter ExbD [Candidatus Methylomirabilis sp.]